MIIQQEGIASFYMFQSVQIKNLSAYAKLNVSADVNGDIRDGPFIDSGG